MRKISVSFAFIFICFYTYALPNINLYTPDNELMYTIDNGSLYSVDKILEYRIEDNVIYDLKTTLKSGYITETEKTISLIFSMTDFDRSVYEFSKNTGRLIAQNTLLDGQIYVDDYFDENTGQIIKSVSHKGLNIDSYIIYKYEDGSDKIQKAIEYNSKNEEIAYYNYLYDKKTEIRIKKEKFSINNKLLEVFEYDKKDGKIAKLYSYADEGKLESLTLFDYETEEPIERIFYKKNGTTSKKKYLNFDNEGKFEIDNQLYLQKDLFGYEMLSSYSTSGKDLDLTETLSANVRKYTFNDNDKILNIIKKIDNNYCIRENSIVLCEENSTNFYCFKKKQNDEIDINSCYEITLKLKKFDYSVFIHSDEGKEIFGYKIGMTYEEIKNASEAEITHIGDDRYFVKPKKGHSLFQKYIVWISQDYGLYYLKAVSSDLYTSNYGTEVKDKFQSLLNSLEKKYGDFEKIDKVKSDSLFKSEDYWLYTLANGAREYKAYWICAPDRYKDYGGINIIALGIDVSGSNSAYIWIEYDFLNSEDAKNKNDDVL